MIRARGMIQWATCGSLLLMAVLLSNDPALASSKPARLQGVLDQLFAAELYFPQGAGSSMSHRSIEIQNGRVTVVIEVQEGARLDRLRTSVGDLGGARLVTHGEWIEARIPIHRLRDTARLEGVSYVRLPYRPGPAAVISEGVALIGANSFFNAGFRGQGITIAVIDLGFDGLGQALANGDISTSFQEFDFTGMGMGGLAHGTAVAEIVHDVAPAARVLLMKVATEVQLGQAVEEAIRLGAKVINHSVVWFNTEFGDGTGGISQIASQAVRRGVAWVNAAGNTALNHWKGDFRDQDDDGWVEFDHLGSESLPLEADIGDTIEVFLNWDAWPNTAIDYDLYLILDGNHNGVFDGGEVFVSSVDPQRGLDPPVEHVRFFAPITGQFLISVAYRGGLVPPPLEVFTTQHTLRTPIREGSVLAPATSPDVIAVGAVAQSQWATGRVQIFSSRGPTSDGRMKPDLVAPDEVSNLIAEKFPLQFAGSGRFAGTSAAAPHVSGALALLMEESTGMTATQAALQLKRNAQLQPPFEPNNLQGFGKINLQLAPEEDLNLILSQVEASAQLVEIGEQLIVRAIARNPHSRTAAQTIQLKVNGRIVAVQEVTLGPNETREISFAVKFDSLGDYTLSLGAQSPLSIKVVEPLRLGLVKAYATPDRSLRLAVSGQGIQRVEIALYDLSGKRVLVESSNEMALQLPLQNRQGIPLANGVYFALIRIDGMTRSERLPLRKFLIFF